MCACACMHVCKGGQAGAAGLSEGLEFNEGKAWIILGEGVISSDLHPRKLFLVKTTGWEEEM